MMITISGEAVGTSYEYTVIPLPQTACLLASLIHAAFIFQYL